MENKKIIIKISLLRKIITKLISMIMMTSNTHPSGICFEDDLSVFVYARFFLLLNPMLMSCQQPLPFI